MKPLKNKKLVILLAAFAVLAIGRLVMYWFEDRPPELPEEYRKIREAAAQAENPVFCKVEDGILHETFRFKDGFLWGKEALVGCLVPLDQAGKPCRGSDQMIFYAPFTGEEKRIPGSQKWLRELAKESGCTVFTMQIPAERGDAEDRSKYFIYPESGWHDMVFKVQAAVAGKFGFRPGKLLVTGESSGGSMAQQLCAANPGKIAAAAWTGGSRYLDRIAPDDRIPRLIVNTWNCPGENASIVYAQKLRGHGLPALDVRTPPNFKISSPDHHAPNPVVYRLITSYLAGIAALRNADNGEIPPPAKWPERDSAGAPLPSPQFAAAWREVHRDAPEKATLLAIVLTSENEPLLRDFLWLLRENGARTVVVPVGDDLPEEAGRLREPLAGLLSHPDLPVFLIGIGSAAQPGVVAALQLPRGGIRRIVLFDAPLDSPYSELSITRALERNPVPVIAYGNDAIENSPGILSRVLKTRGNQEYEKAVREALLP